MERRQCLFLNIRTWVMTAQACCQFTVILTQPMLVCIMNAQKLHVHSSLSARSHDVNLKFFFS